jgi:hypothetical protein
MIYVSDKDKMRAIYSKQQNNDKYTYNYLYK